MYPKILNFYLEDSPTTSGAVFSSLSLYQKRSMEKKLSD
jgi:hypothetical protein